MGNRQFTDGATSILAGTITNTSTSLQVSVGEGALFPALSGTQFFIATIEDTSGNTEYVEVTARVGDVLTIVRAQEGTTAQGFTANLARVELRNTAGTMADLYQKDGDTLTGPMNLGAQTVTNGTLSTGVSIENAVEVVNTPIRGATGITTNQIVVPSDGSPATMGGLAILTAGSALSFSVGMIILWNAAIVDVPAGWQICDGTNGTPDLRDAFVVGAGSSYTLDQSVTLTETTSSVSAGTPTINPVILSLGNLPAHAHPFDYFFGSAIGVIGDPGFGAPAEYLFGGAGSGSRISYAGSSAGSGTSFTPTAAALAGHSHTVGVGPAKALYYIQYVGP